jgi:hypothetical protein
MFNVFCKFIYKFFLNSLRVSIFLVVKMINSEPNKRSNETPVNLSLVRKIGFTISNIKIQNH